MLRFLARHRMLNWRYGRLLWRYLWRRLLTASGRRWKTDGFVFFGRGLEIEIAAKGRVEFGRFVWIGDRTKVRCHEGLVEIGLEDGDGPGMHDHRLPAHPDRRAVRDRRQSDVHRLRPRGRRGRAADPPAGHLQARRRGRLERLDRLRRLRPARGPGRRQLGDRDQLGGDQGRPRERGRRRDPGAGAADAGGARSGCAGSGRWSRTRRRRRRCSRPGTTTPSARKKNRSPDRRPRGADSGNVSAGRRGGGRRAR